MKKQNKMKQRRKEIGLTALDLSWKLQAEGMRHMTEGRVFRIEEGRTAPTDEERLLIGRLLDLSPFELLI